jgi:anti-sigma-K factor RskA
VREQAPLYTAVLLAPRDKSARRLVEGPEVIRHRSSHERTAGQVLDFWTKAEEAPLTRLIAIGVNGTNARDSAKKLSGVSQNQFFGISLEPKGGSPYNKPLAILYVRRAARLM